MEINLENREQIIALLREGICPICGKGPFKVPLLHVTQAHGITQKELKDKVMISHVKGFSDKELHDKRSKEAKEGQAAGILHSCRRKKGEKHTEIAKKKQAFMAKTQNKNLPGIAAAKKARSKPVCKISPDGSIKIYNSFSEAAEDNDIPVSSISRAISGKFKTAGGCGWKELKD